MFRAVLGASVLLLVAGALPANAAATATTYYVDPVAGSDANLGTSTAAAWKSLAKVNGFGFNAGDTVSFKRGGIWVGELKLSRSGAAGNPITVNAYGTGVLPQIGTAGNCVTVTGSYWLIKAIRASGCDWAGFELAGSRNVLDGVQADLNAAGVSIQTTSAFNTVRNSLLLDNNKMSVNDEGGDDDSGAFGVLLNGDDNLIARNTIKGSYAVSEDYITDGAAVEVYDGDRNRVEYNITADNETFTELGHQPGATADNNVFAYNTVTSTKPAAAFLVTRGAGDVNSGPVRGTIAVNNSVNLPSAEAEGWVCYDGCAADILKLRNNVISVGGKTGYEDGAGADENSSVYSGPVTQFALGAQSVLANPLFTSTTDLHLLNGSPAIARGVYVGYTIDLDGIVLPAAGIDAGAYQR